MAAVPALITVEQLYQMEWDGQPYELQAGTIVQLTVPASKHVKLQRRLRQLLEAKLTGWGPVETEMPYRALPQFEYRRADVAATSRSR